MPSFGPINVSNHIFPFVQFAPCPLNRRKYSFTLLSSIPTTPPLRTNGGNSPVSAFRLTVRLHTPKIRSSSGSRISRSLNLFSMFMSLLPFPPLRFFVPLHTLFQPFPIKFSLLFVGRHRRHRLGQQQKHILLPVFRA